MFKIYCISGSYNFRIYSYLFSNAILKAMYHLPTIYIICFIFKLRFPLGNINDEIVIYFVLIVYIHQSFTLQMPSKSVLILYIRVHANNKYY